MLGHLAAKLPISRLQRDLTDSSTLRNLGVAIGHSFLSLGACRRGLGALSLDEAALSRDLADNPEVLGEAVQTVMRKFGHANPYEQLKELTRGQRLNLDDLRTFIEKLDLPEDEEKRLLELTPQSYVGLAARLVDEVVG